MTITDLSNALIEHNRMDIASIEQHGEALSRHVLHQIVVTISESVLLLDASNSNLTIVYANPAYERMSGYGLDELIGQPWSVVQHDDERVSLAELREALGRTEKCELTMLDVHKNGSTRFSLVEVSALRDACGDIRYLLCRQRPTEKRKPSRSSVEVNFLQRELGQARQRIASLSRIDTVTGLLNYSYFVAILTRDLAVARRDGLAIAVAAFEVVELDVYRATFGTKAADSALRMIGAQVSGVFQHAGDLCARRDGATIVVATRGQDEAEINARAARVADKVRRLALPNPKAHASRHLILKSSKAAVSAGGDDAETLVGRCCASLADDGLPEARQAAGV